jgi:predicted flap endonuclease-1-like 5' DNA nuclease
VNTLRKTVSDVNEQAFQTTEKVVDNVLKASGEWQMVFAKALRNGTKLYGEQQDFVLRTLEHLKSQAGKDLDRLQKLVGLDSSAAKKMVADITARAKAEAERVDELVEEVKTKATKRTLKMVNEINKTADKVAKKAKAEFKEAREEFEEVVDKVKAEVNEFAEAAMPKASKPKASKPKAEAKKSPAKRAVTAKAAPRTAAPAPKAAAPQDLKVIEGVGPKLESILKEAGITTYQAIANTPVAKLKQLILAAGPRYKSYDPSSWAEQALLADAGKMEALKALQDQLKGGEVK